MLKQLAKNASVFGNTERIKEQPRPLRHAPLTNIQKLLRQVYTYICATFLSLLNSDYLINKHARKSTENVGIHLATHR